LLLADCSPKLATLVGAKVGSAAEAYFAVGEHSLPQPFILI
jgi:hypothetical protein